MSVTEGKPYQNGAQGGGKRPSRKGSLLLRRVGAWFAALWAVGPCRCGGTIYTDGDVSWCPNEGPEGRIPHELDEGWP